MRKIHRGLSAVTVLAAAGLALGAAAAPASASDNGLVHLMVHTSAKSVWVSTTSSLFDQPISICQPLTGGSGWKDTHQDLLVGRHVKLETFSSNNCSDGQLLTRDLTVPNVGTSNWWVNM